MAYVIFSIDNVTNVHTLAKFLRHMDTQKALGNMEGRMKTLIGSYLGVMEYSFVCNEADFNNHVATMGFTSGQESILKLTNTFNGRTSKRTLASLVYSSGDIEQLGELKSVSKDDALSEDGWTYDPTTNQYFIVE